MPLQRFITPNLLLLVCRVEHLQSTISANDYGWFFEHDRKVGDSDWIGRFDYVYVTDLLDENRIVDRHSGTFSVIIIRPDSDVIYSYVTASYTDFVDDGVIVTETSRDGHKRLLWHQPILSDNTRLDADVHPWHRPRVGCDTR